jgi:hypothetical protein
MDRIMDKPPTYLIDGIKAIAKHNGVIRIEFMRLGIDGQPIPAVEIQVPLSAVASVAEAFKKIS